MKHCCENFYRYCPGVPDCLTELGIVTPVRDGSVKVVIQVHFGTQYVFDVTTESNGLAILDLSTVPAGLLSPWGGKYKIWVGNMPFTIDGVDYDGLVFRVNQTDPKVQNYTIDVYGDSDEY